MNTTLVISTSALADILCNYFGNENFELGPVVRDSVVVGVCSIFGGFVGGQFGIVIGNHSIFKLCRIILNYLPLQRWV